MQIFDGSGAYSVSVGAGLNTLYHSGAGQGTATVATTAEPVGGKHVHDVDIQPHQHGMEHTHTFTPNITNSDAMRQSTHTFAATDLEWSLDAFATAGTQVSTGTAKGSYYEFDITDSVRDANRYPGAEAYTLTFRRRSAGNVASPPDENSAMLDVLVHYRTVIVSLDYA